MVAVAVKQGNPLTDMPYGWNEAIIQINHLREDIDNNRYLIGELAGQLLDFVTDHKLAKRIRSRLASETGFKASTLSEYVSVTRFRKQHLEVGDDDLLAFSHWRALRRHLEDVAPDVVKGIIDNCINGMWSVARLEAHLNAHYGIDTPKVVQDEREYHGAWQDILRDLGIDEKSEWHAIRQVMVDGSEKVVLLKQD